jgi:ribosomal protein L7/L12
MWGTKALAGEKIQAIKDCRTTFGCGLKEAKYFVEQYVDDLRQTYPKYAAHLIDLSNASRENR